jgi:p-aminobenzoyl-glutamate transporter AbgT
MWSSGILRSVTLVRTDVSEELSASIIRVTRIVELGTTWYFFATCVGCLLLLALFLVHRFCHPDAGGAKFLQTVGSYKSHTV